MSRGRSRSSTGVRRAALRVLVALGALGSTLTAAAVHADPVVREARIESARGVALGTGVRSTSSSTQAQSENPANLAMGSFAHIESLFQYEPQLKRYATGASVVDSMTSKVAAGLSARGFFGDNSAGENSGWEGRLSLALPIGDVISLGLAGRYANFTVSDPHARPEREPDEGEKPDRTFKLKAFTLDAAITLRPIEGFSISALGYNLIDPGTPLAPLMVGGSVAFGKNGLSMGGDVLVDLNLHERFNGPKLQVGGGIEYLTQGIAPLRAGYLYDQGRHQHAVSFGFGYLDQRFGAQLSLRQFVVGDKETVLFSAVQYFVQ